MQFRITDHDVPWPDEVTQALVRQNLVTLDQLLRVGQLPDGVESLARLTGRTTNDWQTWLAQIARMVPNELQQLPPEIDPELLLTDDMHDYEQRLEQQQRDGVSSEE